jgi:hypothetical protein
VKVAEYTTPPHKQRHRIASAIVMGAFLWFTFSGRLSVGSTRIAAMQIVATGFIWFCDEYYQDIILKRLIAYRTIAWVALLGIYPLFWLIDLFADFISF